MKTLTESQRTILASLVLDDLTRCQYGDWPGDEYVADRVDLYAVINPKDAPNVTLEGIKARSRDRWRV